jgi:predicted porin
MNGNGMNIQDNNRYKDFIGRVTIHPVEFLTVGASYRYGRHPNIDNDASKPEDTRSRFGFDAEVNYKNFVLQAEYIDGSDVGSYTVGGGCGDPLQTLQGSVDRTGFFVQAAYMTKWNFQPVVKFERFDPNIDAEVTGDLQNVITYGFNYFFNEWTRLQVNYLYKAEENGNVEVPNDALLVQMQIAF